MTCNASSAAVGGSADSTGVSAGGTSAGAAAAASRLATKNAFSADRKGALPGTTWPPSCSWITGSANRDASARATSGGTDASVAPKQWKLGIVQGAPASIDASTVESRGT